MKLNKRKCSICKKKVEKGFIFGNKVVCYPCLDKITDFVIKEDIKLFKELAKK